MAYSGSFLAESASPAHSNDNDDAEDPHDLSFSSNHILRASMVDNLVMSLDQFSAAEFSEIPYTPRNNSYDTASSVRGRGHTFSSSVSSEPDLPDLRSIPHLSDTAPRIPLRHTTRYQKTVQKLPSIRGEDEDSVRSKVYEAQRAAQPGHARRPKNISTGGRSRASSSSSSIDLGHVTSLSSHPVEGASRRSRSFDFGARDRVPRGSKPPKTTSDIVAPTPVIFSGPESRRVPTVDTGSTTLVRKNSTKSSKSAYAKKGRSGTLGVNGGWSSNDPVQTLPTVKSVPSLSNAALEPKVKEGFVHEVASTPRPGFFRRVFGSSKYPSVHSESHGHTPTTLAKQHPGRATPVQDEPLYPTTPPNRLVQRPVRRTSIELSANKENQPIVAKKTSAFFRRRKKSISNSIPPPLPLTLDAELKAEPDQTGGLSPVSSLRAFMDPYLMEKPVPTSGHGRTNSMQGFYTPNLPPPAFGLPPESTNHPKPAGHTRTESHNSNRTLKSHNKPSTLRIPHQDSFLADSSSTEDISRRSPYRGSTRSENDRSIVQPEKPVHEPGSGVETVTRSTSLAYPTTGSHQSARKGSWTSEGVSTASSTAAPPTGITTGHDSRTTTETKGPGALVFNKTSKCSSFASTSDISDYRSAPTTPLVVESPRTENPAAPFPQMLQPSLPAIDAAKIKAKQIFDNADDEMDSSSAGAWLGEDGPDRQLVRQAYMELFDWSNQDIIDALRGLCDRIALKGETQQMDRIMVSFAQRWCDCNPSHLYKSSDVVHTICYSILLLNTDLHLADIGQKMTKAQFVRNALPTIKRIVEESENSSTPRGAPPKMLLSANSVEEINLTVRGLRRPTEKTIHEEDSDQEMTNGQRGSVLYSGSDRAWETQIETILRGLYNSISQEPLPLYGAQSDSNMNANQSNNFLTIGSNVLRRSPSVLSKAHSETNRSRYGESKSLGSRWMTKTRSRPRLPSAAGFGSSRTSVDELSSTWSPSMSSTWSKASLGKTLTSMSVDSFGTEVTHGDYQSSIGFANALSQAIIREDQLELQTDDGLKAGSLLEDDSLELCGAPWAKEGIVKHKCHLEGVDKRSKDRNWNDCFAVIEKGCMRLFSFSSSAKSVRSKSRVTKPGAVVGGGNWQDNAEELWKFMLRHTIASSLPPPGYSKARPYVWALSLPTGAVHLFSVGTPDIVREFVSTANYWSARLSKEPMMGGVSNMEYGWSDGVVNRTAMASESQLGLNAAVVPRPSTQMSMRSSLDHPGGIRSKLPGDKVHINDWSPPQQSMFASQLLEVDQLKALQNYVSNVEDELQKHHELRAMMLTAFSPKHPNSAKAMSNWEKKSSYLLREIVKFRTYIDTLQNAQLAKDRIYKMRKEEEEMVTPSRSSRG
ncbi:hypothetical protein PV08_10458 [Exophiala spinifera]|uniref:SEC7 domain-containing protein n=1 Tax=Exophiala spinifera TaxID=91928 RepID=A0A0D2AWT1_9EURO|nr:uncharacterized protein PV08_10458 [Exophiala spinifera]KIW11158.1 hypothetical protein PV08_10458 [Exophiala spinifera]